MYVNLCAACSYITLIQIVISTALIQNIHQTDQYLDNHCLNISQLLIKSIHLRFRLKNTELKNTIPQLCT